VLLAFIFLNAGIAVTASTVVIFLQYLLLRRYSAGVIDFGTPQNADDRTAMLSGARSVPRVGNKTSPSPRPQARKVRP
jgi:hypothetical protein